MVYLFSGLTCHYWEKRCISTVTLKIPMTKFCRLMEFKNMVWFCLYKIRDQRKCLKIHLKCYGDTFVLWAVRGVYFPFFQVLDFWHKFVFSSYSQKGNEKLYSWMDFIWTTPSIIQVLDMTIPSIRSLWKAASQETSFCSFAKWT